MREIIHIQAGNISNYVGTHYFNTLEALAYADDDFRNKYDHSVVFREGVAPNGDQTFCPRLLLFDYEPNFGALPKISDLYAPEGEDLYESWSGEVEVTRQPPLPKSDYQHALDDGTADEEDPTQPNGSSALLDPHSIKHWSDYNRVYHIPRTLHPLPPPVSFDNSSTIETWQEGVDRFNRLNLESELIEGDFRSFVEESDLLQGIQTTFDTPAFSSFTTTMLEAITDELPKTPRLTFLSMGPPSADPSNIHNSNVSRQLFNEAVTFLRLNEFSSMNIPLQHSSTWHLGSWSELLNFDISTPYHPTAVLSSHIENATLPTRLQASNDGFGDLTALVNHLNNTGGDIRFAHLSGVLPLDIQRQEERKGVVHDFSATLDVEPRKGRNAVTAFTRWSAARGVTGSSQRASLDLWLEKNDLHSKAHSRVVYWPHPTPLPSSYPPFFRSSSLQFGASMPSTYRPPSLSLFSSLTSTPKLSPVFDSYASFLTKLLRRGRDFSILGPGFGREEVEEVREGMVNLREMFHQDIDDDVDEEGDDDGH